jgi:hypothetical protein
MWLYHAADVPAPSDARKIPLIGAKSSGAFFATEFQ